MKNTIIIVLVVLVTLSIFSNFSKVTPSKNINVYSEQQDIDATVLGETKKEETQSLLMQILISWWWFILYYGTGFVIATFVYKDAKGNSKLALNIKPFWWGVITVFEPPLGLLAYWLIHYSKLNAINTNENT